jgi:hypothetical protein
VTWKRSWEGTDRRRAPRTVSAPMPLTPARPVDLWPSREDLFAALRKAGVPPVTADLFAVLTQSGRPDLRERVRSILGWAS